ncbi:MAG: hypothetical protein HXY34_00220 [Candidatus Thorarchaeota archaeon]|nr:hypothetical protein [Candidatus Thorarchaeota archaeon]
MEETELRREFLMTIGRAYRSYGFPEYYGYVEALLALESGELSQQMISHKLREILPEPKYATSVPSVNRALKVLESYGVAEKTGSRKTGYGYRFMSSSSLIASMLQQILQGNRQFVERLRTLTVQNKGKDRSLSRAIAAEIEIAEVWDTIIGQSLSSLSGKQGVQVT